EHGHGGEAGVLDHHPGAVPKVLKEDSHNVQGRRCFGGSVRQKRCHSQRPAEMRAVRAIFLLVARVCHRHCISWNSFSNSASDVPSQRRIVTWCDAACSRSADSAANTKSLGGGI